MIILTDRQNGTKRMKCQNQINQEAKKMKMSVYERLVSFVLTFGILQTFDKQQDPQPGGKNRIFSMIR